MNIPQETFDAMVREAVQDLFKSGLKKNEIIDIVEGQFGRQYVRKCCEEVREP